MSKFDKIFEAREETSGKEQLLDAETTPKAAGKQIKPIKQQSVKATASPASSEFKEKQRGRPKAKRSDPDFIGFTTYIRKETHKNVKIALLQEGNGRELSELVEELLAKWTKQ